MDRDTKDIAKNKGHSFLGTQCKNLQAFPKLNNPRTISTVSTLHQLLPLSDSLYLKWLFNGIIIPKKSGLNVHKQQSVIHLVKNVSVAMHLTGNF